MIIRDYIPKEKMMIEKWIKKNKITKLSSKKLPTNISGLKMWL